MSGEAGRTFKGGLVGHAGGRGRGLGRGDHGRRAVDAVDAAGALGEDARKVDVEDAVWKGELGSDREC